ncbi:alpha-amylase family glycosyl hydrolase [Gloeobacter morelensis]|uniref:Alpha-amylase n=1 Tax=Gloeobacter morelensis MG652769 TaxID=2781736 RepID=A0ABY3PMX6_9CYAN|nr:alpha-amylase family glycosyl hydrolase [Gloeobacter morelensis]UFP95048.1 alpha-amylase [Gloeobacter morelensis MG652769]
MATTIEEKAPRKLSEADLRPRSQVHPSPASWRDQFLYQLLPDRFSDGREAERPLFDPTDPARFQVKDRGAWMAAGKRFVGGTLKGVISKLDYLQGLGVTTLWLNPPWRQRADLETYHGYGIQNFLEIDPRFGTRQDLRDLVDTAHARGLYVILDVIYNHSGNNWFYRDEWDGSPQSMRPYRYAPGYPVHGWRSGDGRSVGEIVSLDDGVWPEEFQNFDWYTRAGRIINWSEASWEDYLSPQVEFRRGDFFDLKDFNLAHPAALAGLARVYQYWIALSDCDGFRVDAVKHVSPVESRKFCTAIHEYAQSIGKDNFLLTGELTDNRMMLAYLDIVGRNLDAALDIVSAPIQLTAAAKGLAHPGAFFGLYDENTLAGAYRQIGPYHVSVLDDHDMSSRSYKSRFAAHGEGVPNLARQVAHAVGVQLTMPGIPSIYYGTEQALDGSESDHDYGIDGSHEYVDRYVREAMFGGAFGAFRTEGCHFFNPDHPTYLRIAAIARLRNRQDAVGKTLRRGHHYLRETAFLQRPFVIPGPGELAAWSQILFETEVLMVLNTHGLENRGAEVTVETSLHPEGASMAVLYHSEWSDDELRNPPSAQTVPVEYGHGRATVRIDLPPCAMVILA